MAKMKKIIVAGCLVVEAVYSRGSRHDPPKVRAAKRKASSEAQARMNRVYSYQKLELMLAANFPTRRSGLVVTLTFDDAHLPRSWKQAEDRLKYFRTLLSAERRKQGKELVMFWSPEDDYGQGRYHYHCVINATGHDYEAIRRLWIYGSAIEIDPLQPTQQSKRESDSHYYEALARYMTKEPPKRLGARSWSYTRNAKKPEMETFTVPDDTPVQAPKGSTVLMDEAFRTDYASFHVIKYLTPGWQAVTVRAGRKRKRHRD